MKFFTAFFHFFCWVVLTHFTFSQSTEVIDSLQSLLAQTHPDTTRVRLLNELAYEWAYHHKDTAIQISNRALALAQTLKNPRLLGNAYNGLGSLYISKGWYTLDNEKDTVNHIQYFEEAAPFLTKAIAYFEEAAYEKGVALGYGNLAVIKLETGILDQSLEYSLKALAYFEKLDYKIYMSISYNHIGNVYLLLEQYGKALTYTFKSLEVSKTIESKFDIRNAYGKLSQIYETMGEYKKALEYKKLYNDVHNMILNEETQHQINELEQEYQAAKKEQEIELLNKDSALQKAQIRRQNYFLIFTLTVVSLLVIITTLLQRANNQKKKMNQVLETQKNQLEQKNDEIQRQRDLLEQQNTLIHENNTRLEELNEAQKNMMAMVAHDLKSPLNKINGLVEIMKMSGPLNEEQESIKEKIQQVTTTGGQLVSDLVTLNQYETDEVQVNYDALPLDDLLKRIMNEHDAYASQKNINLHLHSVEKGLSVHTNQELFTRIMDNLLSNAIKFSSAGSTVRVRTQTVNHHWIVVVEDEGPGLPEGDLPKMFKKFQRLSTLPTGGESSTGLGLAIVKILMRKLYGEIAVESTVGKGTTFTLTFPFERNV